jgi:hypothetical protein
MRGEEEWQFGVAPGLLLRDIGVGCSSSSKLPSRLGSPQLSQKATLG